MGKIRTIHLTTMRETPGTLMIVRWIEECCAVGDDQLRGESSKFKHTGKTM